MAVCARGSVLVFMRYLPDFFQLFFFGGGGGKYGSGRFSGSGADAHQLIFFSLCLRGRSSSRRCWRQGR